MKREIASLTRARLAEREREDLVALLCAWPIDGRWRTPDAALQEAWLNTALRVALTRIAGGGGEINLRLLTRALDRLANKPLVGRILETDGRSFRLASTEGALRLPANFPPTPKLSAVSRGKGNAQEAEYERRHAAHRAGAAARANVVAFRTEGELLARRAAISSGQLVDLDAWRARVRSAEDEPPPSAA